MAKIVSTTDTALQASGTSYTVTLGTHAANDVLLVCVLMTVPVRLLALLPDGLRLELLPFLKLRCRRGSTKWLVDQEPQIQRLP